MLSLASEEHSCSPPAHMVWYDRIPVCYSGLANIKIIFFTGSSAACKSWIPCDTNSVWANLLPSSAALTVREGCTLVVDRHDNNTFHCWPVEFIFVVISDVKQTISGHQEDDNGHSREWAKWYSWKCSEIQHKHIQWVLFRLYLVVLKLSNQGTFHF